MPLSRLYRVLGDFHVRCHLAAKLLTNFLIFTLVPLALNLPMKSHSEVVKGAKQLLPLQLGFERFQFISSY